MNEENEELLWDRERRWDREVWRILEDEHNIDGDKLTQNLRNKVNEKIEEYLNKDDGNFNEFNPDDWQTFKDNFYCKFCPEIASFVKENQNSLKLADCVEINYLEGAEKLLKDGANPNTLTYTYSKKSSLLMRACSIRNYNMAKLLIENGADVNAKDTDGKTALHLLTYYGTIDSAGMLKIAKLLIDNGAKINLKDNYGNTALDNVKNFTINPYDKDKEKIENDIKELKSYLIQKGAKMGKEIKTLEKPQKTTIKEKSKSKSNDYGMGM